MEYTLTNIFVRLVVQGLFVFLFIGSANADLAVCAKHPADIFFALDTSTSIGKQNFDREKLFVINFVHDMDIGPNDVQVSFGTFSDNARRYFALNAHPNITELEKAIRNVQYEFGQTHTNLVFQLAERYVFTSESGDRPLATNIMFVLTDGMSQDHTATVQEAQKLKNAGVKIYTIGIGNQTNKGELLDIASDPNHVFMVDTFQDLSSIHTLVQNTYCEGYSSTNRPTGTTATPTTAQKSTSVQTSPTITSPSSSTSVSSTNTPTSTPIPSKTTLTTVSTTKTTMSSSTSKTSGPTTPMTSTTKATSTSGISSTITSSTTKTTPTTNTVTTVSTPSPPTSIATPPPIPEGPCEDKITNCAGYGDYVCTNYRTWAIQNCARFCLFCHDLGTNIPPSTAFNIPTTPTSTTTTTTTALPTTTLTTRLYTVCEDKVDRCSLYGPDICFKYTTWAAVQCPKFCVFCEPSTTTSTTTTTTTTTTTQPPPPTAPRVCADLIPNCAEFGPTMCMENREYASNNCPAFCLLCTPIETTIGSIEPQAIQTTTPSQITTNPAVIIIGRKRLDRLQRRKHRNL